MNQAMGNTGIEGLGGDYGQNLGMNDFIPSDSMGGASGGNSQNPRSQMDQYMKEALDNANDSSEDSPSQPMDWGRIRQVCQSHFASCMFHVAFVVSSFCVRPLCSSYVQMF